MKKGFTLVKFLVVVPILRVFAAVGIGKENYIGVQFHPEKSGNSGQKFIYNWLKWIP